MTSYTEHELIVPSLKIISKNKDGIDTKKLIDELRKLLKPNGEDILVLSNIMMKSLAPVDHGAASEDRLNMHGLADDLSRSQLSRQDNCNMLIM